MHMLLYLLMVFIIFGAIWWLIAVLKLPPPFDLIARAICAVVLVLLLISVLMGLTGPYYRLP